LIDALISEHKFVRRSPGISTGFDGQGGGGLSVGGRPKVEKRTMRNAQVLNALTSLTPQGINFGFDQEGWREWYVHVNTPRGGQLRRSE